MIKNAAGSVLRVLIAVAAVVTIAVIGIGYFEGNPNVRSVVDAVVKKPLPVQVTYRKSVVGNGLVAKFVNETGSQLVINVVIRSHLGRQSEPKGIQLPANGEVEVGWMEGWEFHSGDEITMSHDGYADKILRMP